MYGLRLTPNESKDTLTIDLHGNLAEIIKISVSKPASSNNNDARLEFLKVVAEVSFLLSRTFQIRFTGYAHKY